MKQQHICPNCGPVDIGQQIAGKILLSLASVVLSASTLKNPFVISLLVILAFVLGNQIDREANKELAKLCPQCGAILAITEFLL